MEAGVGLLLLHQRFRRRCRLSSTSPSTTRRSASALACHVSQFAPAAAGARRDAPDVAAVPAADRKPRRAVRRARRRRLRRRHRRQRSGAAAHLFRESARPVEHRHRLLRVGRRQRDRRDRAGEVRWPRAGTRCTSSAPTRRSGWASFQPGLSFHRVNTPAYPLFREPQYLLSLANQHRARRARIALDIIHAHYAVPHATAAYPGASRFSSRRHGTARRGSSRRCTAPTSPSSAAIARIRKPSPSRSSSPTA